MAIGKYEFTYFINGYWNVRICLFYQWLFESTNLPTLSMVIVKDEFTYFINGYLKIRIHLFYGYLKV